ncbi:hypothetical protein F5878DRAFT_664852 [Lentinula raphanica]|uniref:Uncharacterized protein n=1 Tax=Lentinula raphanica TaxID=153919 RepID=A0AA38P133_9AGAR|nr:hypothetical protein F5878DRAFT_664852 [Lentinula raphanica]
MSPSSRHRPTVLLITTIICSACSAPVVTCATPPNKLRLRSQWDKVFAYLSRLFYPRYSPLAMVFVASTVANVKEDKTGSVNYNLLSLYQANIFSQQASPFFPLLPSPLPVFYTHSGPRPRSFLSLHVPSPDNTPDLINVLQNCSGDIVAEYRVEGLLIDGGTEIEE